MKRVEINNINILNQAESRNVTEDMKEVLPFAQNQPFQHLIEIMPDKESPWANSLMLYSLELPLSIGEDIVSAAAPQFLNTYKNNGDIDLLSIKIALTDTCMVLVILIRMYKEEPDFRIFFDKIHISEYQVQDTSNRLIIPNELKLSELNPTILVEHERKKRKQDELLLNASNEQPFLNQLSDYEMQDIYNPLDYAPLIYDLQSTDKKTKTKCLYKHFNHIFQSTMKYVSTIGKNAYENSLDPYSGNKKMFLNNLKHYIEKEFVLTHQLPKEDIPPLMRKIEKSLYQLYIIQDLIDDPDVTDIKITAPDSIRSRIKGKSYLTNINFVDANDYYRFVTMLLLQNGIDPTIKMLTFTDTNDDKYRLRITYTAAYVSSNSYPIIHVRKESRVKMMEKELIEAGMFDEKQLHYFMDCGRHSRGVIIAGAPGSGKSIFLNWFMEKCYEESADILVIQESDEIFAYRKGVVITHTVTQPNRNEEYTGLEELGQRALVEGCNVFVIGEVKGGEICSAITLANSGCRTALTIHSTSSMDTIDKMADLAMRGIATSYDDAKRMLKAFQTIIYIENFQVKEITEIMGYDNKKKDMIYRPIYRKDM